MSDQQLILLEPSASYTTAADPVRCLGLEFENEAARRAYFTELLRQKLKDPEFRKIEGFPLGADDDMLALSDPPYYTACPNPWIAEFIKAWEAEKPAPPVKEPYHREPFAADVSEGKNDPIYNAHSYHTKVPHKAIMRYILHYTEPGDIVFDGFCGTGMTGVAAQMCGDRAAVESLGYQVKPDGTILQQARDLSGNTVWTPFSKLGARKAVLNDLSPAATFIAYNYNTPVDVAQFEAEARRILQDVAAECGWMYETKHTDGKTGTINYTVWSDVFVCPDCSMELVFWEAAVDKEAGEVKDAFPCPHCSALLTKRNMDRAWVTKYDRALKETVRQAKQVPVLINYRVGKKRFEKTPDDFDLALIERIEQSEIPYWFPTTPIPKGDKTGEPLRIGITHAHHFYTERNLRVIGLFKEKNNHTLSSLWFWLNAAMRYLSKLSKLGTNYYFHGGGGSVNAGILGTLYIPSFSVENHVVETLKTRLPKLSRVLRSLPKAFSIISSYSTGQLFIPDNSSDYIFIDPPFGSNLNYSELSFMWEAWLKVWTNNRPEAIENKTQGKGSTEYRQLMTTCFREAFRVLKPGRWMTVEFSNTQASVWNNIQTALADAGFIVANVSALDKQQGSFNAVTNTTSVKQDLVISAYKPNGGFSERFEREAATEEGVWDFVRTHLGYLPIVKMQGDALAPIPDRDPRILFDQVVAFYVRKNYFVPISSPEFQAGLRERFAERDDMFFLPEQVAEYDRKKMTVEKVVQRSLFVSDEASAIDWLRVLLKAKPQTYQDMLPQFIQETQRAWKKTETALELSTLLEQNFLCYAAAGPVPEQIHDYLARNYKEFRNLSHADPALQPKARDRWYVPDPNKASDLEKLREKALLKEFEAYRHAPRKLKVFRLEAVRAGFKTCWQAKDYATIITVAEKIPHTVLEEDPKLLMWYDQAVTRVEAGRQTAKS